MESLTVETTQNVDIEFQLASVGDRIIAYFLDGFFTVCYVLLLVLILGVSGDSFNWIFMLLMLPVLFYHLLCEMFFNGQSLGKMIMKLRVVKKDGSELTFGACFIRWLFRLVDIALSQGLVALLTIVITGKGQRVGDLAASTTVLKMDGKSHLSDTIYIDLKDDYVPVYPEVQKLSDSDMQTIKEVLLVASKDSSYTSIGAPHPLVIKTKEVVLKKMGVETKMSGKDLLNTLLKDYNYYHK
ncbi:MAG: RDD family protein [Marinilabiliaceae bacterium]|nr:RDD family protein [Marinilabiliaceae bacterium]